MNVIAIVGRILFAILFLYNGWNHFAQYSGLVDYAAMMGAPLPSVTVPLTGLMLIAGGLSILVGYYHRIGSWLLAVFLILAAFIMHPFWSIEDPMAASTEQLQFLKDLSLAGAALLISLLTEEQIRKGSTQA